MQLLSVVIITKNEARNIAKAIESVQRALQAWPESAILVVDSVSTDQTIEIAKNYPVQIIRLDENYFLSPAAGRFIGFKHCNSQYVFFLDGDMIVDESWFENALPVMDANPQLAGIAGKCKEFIYNEQQEVIEEIADRFHTGSEPKTLFSLGGSVLYRSSALQAVGSFNPYLANEEELELGMRLRRADFLLQRIPVPMTTHFTQYYGNENPSGLTWRQVRRDWRMGRYDALGKVLFLLWKNPYKGEFIKQYRKGLAFLGLYFLGFIFVLADIILLFMVWLPVFLGLLISRALLKRHLLDTLLFFLEHSLVAYGFLWGIISPLPKADSYQPKLEFINK